MTTFQRRQRIVELLRERPAVRVADLAEMFAGSPGAIRNDLRILNETEQSNRVRGGGGSHGLRDSPPWLPAGIRCIDLHDNQCGLDSGYTVDDRLCILVSTACVSRL